MARDLFKERGINYQKRQPRDLFAERGIKYKKREEESPWISAANSFNYPFEKLAHGILQPLLENGYLGQNVSNVSKNMGRQREEDLLRGQEQNPLSSFAGSALGEVGINLPGMALGGPGILSSILSGAGTGALRGGAEYTSPEESRLDNALYRGAEGGIFGAIPGPAAKIGKYAKNIKNAFPIEKIAERVVSDRNAVKSAYKKGYGDFFKEASKEGIESIKAPRIKTTSIYNNATKNESQALKDFLANPTLKSAHSAQSDLGKVIRRLEKINESTGLKTPQIKALEAAKDAQKRIRGSMFQGFSKAKKPEFANRYGALTEGYKKEVLPYTQNKSINAHRRNELTGEDLVNKLYNEKKFRAQLLGKYPEMEARKSILPGLTKLGLGAGGLYGASELYKILKMLGSND